MSRNLFILGAQRTPKGGYVGALKDISSNRTSTETNETNQMVITRAKGALPKQRTRVG